jgi:aspartyl protease family protein
MAVIVNNLLIFLNMNFQNSDWQNFIYLFLILLVLLSSLIARRDFAFSKLFKALAIWGLIGFVLVLLYSYRFEFADFKNRVLGELNPSKARLEEDKLIVNLSKDGHFYLNVKINNKEVRFMIDTGASDIVLSKNDAKKIAINLDNLNFNRIYQTANGKSFGASIKLDEIEISKVKFFDVNASVNSGEMSVSLMGMDFLRRFKRYEFYQDKLILEF